MSLNILTKIYEASVWRNLSKAESPVTQPSLSATTFAFIPELESSGLSAKESKIVNESMNKKVFIKTFGWPVAGL